MKRFPLVPAVALFALVMAAACSTSRAAMDPAVAGMDMSTGEWRSLIDPSLSAWRGYREAALPAGWRVEDGVLLKEGTASDIITREEFGNFELDFDWRLAPGGNAGVFYRATEEYEHIYWSGPEYQLLDDAGHPDGRNPLTSAGAAYGVYAPNAKVVSPANEWNRSRIVARGRHVEHWLNDHKVVDYELGGDDWTRLVKASKFVEWPSYGRASRGHIGIQGDHRGALAIRNLRIRVLP